METVAYVNQHNFSSTSSSSLPWICHLFRAFVYYYTAFTFIFSIQHIVSMFSTVFHLIFTLNTPKISPLSCSVYFVVLYVKISACLSNFVRTMLSWIRIFAEYFIRILTRMRMVYSYAYNMWSYDENVIKFNVTIFCKVFFSSLSLNMQSR